MGEDWLDRWERGRTGWHEADGNEGLKSYWRSRATSVLVPLCGKSPDIRWLAERGHEVVGVEMAERAIRAFFDEQSLGFTVEKCGQLDRYGCVDLPIRIYHGDYFDLGSETCEALYDRGAIVAVDPRSRPAYVAHTDTLLVRQPDRFVVTLEYDQSVVQGPPYSLEGPELATYWPGLERIAECDDLATCPPKFIKAGLTEISEVFWGSFR